mgnify:CR=1 FL=1
MKKSVSKIMLVLIVLAIVLYTAATFVLQYFTSVEISPTLTTAWFTFWTVEIVALAAIKTSKVKHDYDVKNNCVQEEDIVDIYNEVEGEE